LETATYDERIGLEKWIPSTRIMPTLGVFWNQRVILLLDCHFEMLEWATHVYLIERMTNRVNFHLATRVLANALETQQPLMNAAEILIQRGPNWRF
jgi:hypothetical protein